MPKQAVNLRKATASLNTGNSNKSVPVAFGQVRTMSGPRIDRRNNGDCRVSHREFLTDIIPDGSEFQVLKFPMNPGCAATFPWLNRIAQNYESYRFELLRFHYETAVSSATSGTVMLIPDYDPDDPLPRTKKEALPSRGSARAQPWMSFVMTSSKEDLAKRKTYYVRSDSAAPDDLRSSDTGNLFVALSGVAASPQAIGELWVEYDVQLMTPASDETHEGEIANLSFVRGINENFPSDRAYLLNPDGQHSQISVKNNRITFGAPGVYFLEYVNQSSIGPGGNGAYVTVNPISPEHGIRRCKAAWQRAPTSGGLTTTQFAVETKKKGAFLDLIWNGVMNNSASDILAMVLDVIPGWDLLSTALSLFNSIKGTTGLAVGEIVYDFTNPEV